MAVSRIDEAGLNINQYGNRNLIINGGMKVAQRGTSTTGVTASGYYACDRFEYNQSGRDQAIITVSQASDAPDGFTKSFKIETTTAETAIDSTEYFMARYKIEAQDLQHLNYGASSAKQLTLSFWVKSSIAATYAVYLYSPDGSRIIGSTYTIDTASTWEYKTITFAGDTGGTINDDTGNGLDLTFILAAGSDMRTTDNTSWSAYAGGKLAYGHTTAANAVMTTANATWQITGIQLEVGDTDTPFEHRSYGDELARCQRYYAQGGIILSDSSPDRYYNTINLPCEMRAQPTVSVGGIDSGSGGTMVSTWDSSGSSTSKRNFYQGANNSVISNSWFAFDAEL